MLTTPALAQPSFATLRRREFARLDRAGLAYLDYTGSALYAESQLRVHHAMLAEGVFGNPHSDNDPSEASTELLQQARHAVLDFLHADPGRYLVCFTANCSAAIKLVAESYPFSARSALVLSADNHNSVNGIREYARRAGASVHYLALDDDLRLADPARALCTAAGEADGPSLFAFPAQSNFSGVHHPLDLVDDAQQLGFDVLVDAAAFAPSNPLSLTEHAPEFVALSFYKIFGYPTGVGALIIRRDAVPRLRRPWFAGGTVDFVSVQNDTHQLVPGAERFEDGTPDFLNVAALPAGFAFVSEVGLARTHDHVVSLTAALLDGLGALHHGNGAPVVRIYGPRGTEGRGGTIAFNVVDARGTPIRFAVVEHRARAAKVALRAGCFCNPGAAEYAFGFEPRRARDCMRATAAEFTIERFAECMGPATAVGALRASVGMANNLDDVARAVALVASFAT